MHAPRNVSPDTPARCAGGPAAGSIEQRLRMPLASVGAAVNVLADKLPPGDPDLGLVRLIQYEVRRAQDILAESACAASVAVRSARSPS